MATPISDEIRESVARSIAEFARKASGNSQALAIGATALSLALMIQEVEGDQSEIARLALRRLRELGVRG